MSAATAEGVYALIKRGRELNLHLMNKRCQSRQGAEFILMGAPTDHEPAHEIDIAEAERPGEAIPDAKAGCGMILDSE